MRKKNGLTARNLVPEAQVNFLQTSVRDKSQRQSYWWDEDRDTHMNAQRERQWRLCIIHRTRDKMSRMNGEHWRRNWEEVTSWVGACQKAVFPLYIWTAYPIVFFLELQCSLGAVGREFFFPCELWHWSTTAGSCSSLDFGSSWISRRISQS